MKNHLFKFAFFVSIAGAMAQESHVNLKNSLRLAGAHRASNSHSGKETHFLIEPLPSKQGSYVGLLFQVRWSGLFSNSLHAEQAQLYLITPSFESTALFNLQPFVVSEKGQMILGTIDPVLELAILEEKEKGRIHFSVNKVGNIGETIFAPEVNFEGESSKFRWLQFHASKYNLTRDTDYFVKVSEMDQAGRLRVGSTHPGELDGQLAFQLASYKSFQVFKSSFEQGVKVEHRLGSAFFVTYNAEPHIFLKSGNNVWETYEAEVDLDGIPSEIPQKSQK